MPSKPGFVTVGGERIRLSILRFVAGHIGRTGVPPTRQEIADAVYASPSTVQWHLARLAAAGRVERDRRQVRGLRLVLTPGIVTVPLRWCADCDQEMPADHTRHLATLKTPNPGSENP